MTRHMSPAPSQRGVATLIASVVLLFALAKLYVEWQAPMKDDVAWLMHVARRWLQGGEPYVSEIEINPPPIIWLSAGAVLLAQVTGLSTLTVYPLMVTVIVGLCAAWVASLLRRRGARIHPTSAFAAVVLVLLVIPAAEFGQREHLIAAFALPYLAWRLPSPGKAGTDAAEGFAVGLLAGLCCALKPHYVLAFLVVEAGMALRDRRIAWAPAAGAVVSAGTLGLLTLALHPAYLADVVPLALDLYRIPFSLAVAVPPGAVLWGASLLAAGLLWAMHRRVLRDGDLVLVLLLFSVGAGLVFLLQLRGFAYHRIPATSTTALALCALIAFIPRGALLRGLAALLLLALAGQATARFLPRVAIVAGTAPALEHRIADALRVHGARSYMAFSSTLGRGFPVVYLAGVEWASRFPSMWAVRAELAAAAGQRGDAPPSVRGRRWVVQDFLAACPDMVLVDPADGVSYPEALSQFDSAFADAWAGYAQVESLDGVDLFLRRPDAPPCGAAGGGA